YFLGELLSKLIFYFIFLHKIFKKEFKKEIAIKKIFLMNIVNVKRFKFLIYLLFFIFLIISSVSFLNSTFNYFPKEVYYSINYAFATFIAFDRVAGNLHLMKINFYQLAYTLGRFNRPGIPEEEKYYRLKRRQKLLAK
ncbi:MAG: hypothetical protein RIQ89_1068, partial [Bacteroidota bacterium]